jgi:hypothetical protein
MQRTLYILLIALLPLNCFPQFMKPDYAAIEKAMNDTQSAYYYKPLLQRYLNNDTLLTREEYRYLYYGSLFMDKPGIEEDNSGSAREERDNILAKKKLDATDNRSIIRLTHQVMQPDPFDMKELYIIATAYGNLNDSTMYNVYIRKLKRLVGTILASGDGKTDETGYHITEVSHEHFILKVLEYEFLSQKLTKHPCDYIMVKSNKDNVEGVYFDVSQIFGGYSSLFGEGDKGMK